MKKKIIAGIDEAGRGPLAGPVTAAVVVISSELPRSLTRTKIRDSKQLSAKQREEIFERIKDEPKIEWRVSCVYPKTIDRINIWQATLLTWKRCLKKLKNQPDFLFLDGRAIIPRLKIEQQAIIKGDQKILLLSLASIIAKVHRDRLMKRLGCKYPEYEFAQHKGYGTKLHSERLRKFGPCEIHRRSFRPIFESLPFREKVYYVVSRIPRGQTMAYKEVAQKIGHPKAFRAIGNVLNKNTDPRIPCHRVIRSDGRLSGYNRGIKEKEKLLELEKSLTKFKSGDRF